MFLISIPMEANLIGTLEFYSFKLLIVSSTPESCEFRSKPITISYRYSKVEFRSKPITISYR